MSEAIEAYRRASSPPNWSPDYVPSEGEWDARRKVHEMTGEHWFVNCYPEPGDGEAHRCRICWHYEGFRGPGA